MRWRLGVLDLQYKPNMTKYEVIDLTKRAVHSASLRDSASGDGLDVRVITNDGTKELPEKKTNCTSFIS